MFHYSSGQVFEFIGSFWHGEFKGRAAGVLVSAESWLASTLSPQIQNISLAKDKVHPFVWIKAPLMPYTHKKNPRIFPGFWSWDPAAIYFFLSSLISIGQGNGRSFKPHPTHVQPHWSPQGKVRLLRSTAKHEEIREESLKEQGSAQHIGERMECGWVWGGDDFAETSRIIQVWQIGKD